jgi:hypothetical protein
MTEFSIEILDDGRPRPEWIGGANCYLTEWGEYERSGASWSFTKTLREARSHNYHYSSSEYDVVAKLHISGIRRGRRYIPTHWGVSIEFGKYSDGSLPEAEFPHLRGKCRSVADAHRQASQAITEDRVQALLKVAYSLNFQTRCVYRLKDDTPRQFADRWSRDTYDEAVLLDPANWEPWASDCCTSQTWARWMPPGRYFEISRDPDGTLHGYDIKHEGGFTSGGGFPGCRQLAKALNGWTSTEVERLIEAAGYQVRAVFGEDATLKVETHTEPETGVTRPFLVIETKLGVEEADQRLRKLEDRWWLKVMPVDGSLALELRHV